MPLDYSVFYDKIKEKLESFIQETGYQVENKNTGNHIEIIARGISAHGARPGMGKTTLGVNIAENIARRNKNVLVISQLFP